jgi:hypothetical protein
MDSLNRWNRVKSEKIPEFREATTLMLEMESLGDSQLGSCKTAG